MRVSAIVEARMTSTRLPGKVMLPAGGVPLLGHLLNRISQTQTVDTLVVATPDDPANKPIWDFCGQEPSIRVVKGSENDVMGRVLKAAKETRTDVIVEITADCPVIDPAAIDLCAAYFICGEWDFVGNIQPRTWPRGMDVRVFSTKVLEAAYPEASADLRAAYWQEHVSPWFYERPGYKCLNLPADDRYAYPDLNLSVDTAEDYRRVKGVIESLFAGNPAASTREIVEYLASLPGYENLAVPRDEIIPASWAIDPAHMKDVAWLR